MKEPIDRSHEINTANPDFQKRIDAITDRALTPESIETYADEALDDLISVINDATSSYDRQPTIKPDNGADHERAALLYYGVDRTYVETTLDHIADTAEDISRIKTISEKLTQGGVDVITPPDPTKSSILLGDGSYEQKKTIPRLQTVLLILEKNFGINVDPETSDAEEFLLIPGAVTSGMMRQTPYNVLDIPTLNRIIDVCDEEGNRTFVFDREKLLEVGITAHELKDMTKDDLKELLALHDGIGRDFVYSDKFVENIASLLGAIPQSSKIIKTDAEVAKLLKSEFGNTPEGFLTVQDICKELGYGRTIVTNAIIELADELQEPLSVPLGANRTIYVYSPDQIRKINQCIIEQGLFIDTPEGYHTLDELSDMFGVGNITILRLAHELNDKLGLIIKSRSPNGSNYRPVYSPAQQEVLRTHLIEKGTLVVATEGSLGLKELADELGLERNAVANAIDALKDKLGEVTKAKLGKSSVPRSVYSIQQQNVVRDYFEEKGMLAPPVPDGYKSIKQIADSLGVSWKPIMAAISAIGEDLGKPIRAKFTAIVSDAYSPEQQEIIKSYLEEKGTLVLPPPDGYLSAKAIETATGLNRDAIERAVEKLNEELGPILLARVGVNRTSTYSPSQQRIIVEWLEKNMRRRSDSKVDFTLARAALRITSSEL